MRVLLIHNEATYFAGAERMLGYYLEGLRGVDCEVAVAAVATTRIREIIPPSIRLFNIPANQPFSVGHLARQVGSVLRDRNDFPFDLLHAWTARDWELASLVSLISRRPAIGTLHDHPKASFISPNRRRLMRWCARRGLRHVVCVSNAVRAECVASGYSKGRLSTIHNGLPQDQTGRPRKEERGYRIGYLGAFSERKGFRGLFAILDHFHRLHASPWELLLAGDAQDADGRRLVGEMSACYSRRDWWSQVRWLGWVNQPADFLRSIDVLLMPSSEFDPFPTVLLEAGRAGIPVVAARVGGVEEIVAHGETGLLFDQGSWEGAARQLMTLLVESGRGEAMGKRALARAAEEFTVAKMVAKHLELYSTLKLR